MHKLWLAFDIGTSNTKAALVTPEAEIVASASSGYDTQMLEGGVVEQNADDWWKAVIACCQELSANHDLHAVDAIAVTGQMQNTILIDASGQPVRPVILYSDTRAKDESRKIEAILGNQPLRQLTGNDQDAGSLLAKLLWLHTNEPDSLTRASNLLMGAADFVAYQLTGAVNTDTTTASTTGLMNIATRTSITSTVLDQLAIGEYYRLLPNMVPGGTQIGTLLDLAADILGLKTGIAVHLGPGDAGAATIGAGSGEPGQVYGYVGTSGWIAFTATEPANPDSGAITIVHPRNGYFIPIAPLLTAGGNLQWIQDLFSSSDVNSLIDSAIRRPISDLFYLPYLNGERSPFRDPLARGAFIGLNPSTEKDDIVRAVLEGVVYAYRHALSALVSHPVQSLVLSGGGTQSDAWCQLFADIIGTPIHIMAEAENVGVRGSVLAAQVANGQMLHYAFAGVNLAARTFQPQNDQHDHFDHKFNLFLDLYIALQPHFNHIDVFK